MLGEATRGLRSTQDQVAVIGEHGRDALEDPPARGRIEVDEHVAQEDDVEAAEPSGVGKKIVALEADPGAQSWTDLPVLPGALEVPDEELDRQAALHLEMGVAALAGPGDGTGGEVGAQNLEPPAVDGEA
jgi:hypothetical protein